MAVLIKKKIGYWHSLDRKILIKRRILKTNNLQKNLFYKNIYKIGYSKKIPLNLKNRKNDYLKKITKAFQRRFRPEIVNGEIDEECLIISTNLIKQ